ncbi:MULTISPECIES: FKBP-type peptidyl-prolyl cis-trans isomerase [unclassified Isoptericola]|uniref:FKBP-type peptidyl-prolyl cis-trans isomerase n=1 Tax=unclassified Isoptericola TaxID=2623355 RepID=UPI002713B312|nr:MULTISPECIES: FKBP-type peptidyl-prolyl cis-trans isomerase [unclassified Isoptericola]MDO8144986.1 FKBP-type peptidyl-prolyl cis-trans isomerase [Isoptericola sp. 178]MDO8148619.1 FKBP-type peptidyl-prolyl cis-trans isomerase [Isoptericola sp. b515]MDO8151435.1 FKBP-type peptidyl-prolyl cis-trans isomerase [Isoptericola sp. b408]
MLPARPRLLVAVLAVVLTLTGCGTPVWDRVTPSPLPSQVPVQVTGPEGQPPALEYPQPYQIVQSGSRTLRPGGGEPLETGEPVLLHMYAEDGRDGSVISSTYLDAPAWYTFDPDSLGQNLYDSLRGKRVGARVLVVEKDDDVPVVLVVDVLPTRATGDVVEPVEGLPQVVRDPDGSPTVLVEGGEPPGELVVQPLIRGDGPQVEVGQMVTARYVAVRWSDGRVVDSSWGDGVAPQSATIGIGRLVEGWDQGLLEQSVGSQVMLVVPPHLGYGGTNSELADETLVYVIDILDARFQVTQDEPVPDEDGEGADEAAGTQGGGASSAGTTEG